MLQELDNEESQCMIIEYNGAKRKSKKIQKQETNSTCDMNEMRIEGLEERTIAHEYKESKHNNNVGSDSKSSYISIEVEGERAGSKEDLEEKNNNAKDE